MRRLVTPPPFVCRWVRVAVTCRGMEARTVTGRRAVTPPGETTTDLEAVGFEISDVHDAPDRPGLGSVFIVQRPR